MFSPQELYVQYNKSTQHYQKSVQWVFIVITFISISRRRSLPPNRQYKSINRPALIHLWWLKRVSGFCSWGIRAHGSISLDCLSVCAAVSLHINSRHGKVFFDLLSTKVNDSARLPQVHNSHPATDDVFSGQPYRILMPACLPPCSCFYSSSPIWSDLAGWVIVSTYRARGR